VHGRRTAQCAVEFHTSSNVTTVNIARDPGGGALLAARPCSNGERMSGVLTAVLLDTGAWLTGGSPGWHSAAQAENGEQSRGAGAHSVWSASGDGNEMASPRSNDAWGVVGALKA
jgi:hypothetical protein